MRFRLFYKQLASIWLQRVGIVFAILATVITATLLLVQLRSLGRGEYDIWMLFRYIGMLLPSELYGISAMGFIIATLWALLDMVKENILVVMMVSGFTFRRLVCCILSCLVVCVSLGFIFGEWYGASWEQEARMMKKVAIHKNDIVTIRKGQWVHSDQHWVYINRAGLNSLYNVWDFTVGPDSRTLESITHIQRLDYSGQGKWYALDDDVERIHGGKVDHNHVDSELWPVPLKPSDLPYFEGNWSQKTLAEIHHGIQRMTQYGYAVTDARYLFWKRVWWPVNIITLVLMVLPGLAILGRHVSLGWQFGSALLWATLVAVVGDQGGMVMVTHGWLPDYLAAGCISYLALLSFIRVLFRR